MTRKEHFSPVLSSAEQRVCLQSTFYLSFLPQLDLSLQSRQLTFRESCLSLVSPAPVTLSLVTPVAAWSRPRIVSLFLYLYLSPPYGSNTTRTQVVIHQSMTMCVGQVGAQATAWQECSYERQAISNQTAYARLLVPKRQYGITTLHCIISQNNAALRRNSFCSRKSSVTFCQIHFVVLRCQKSRKSNIVSCLMNCKRGTGNFILQSFFFIYLRITVDTCDLLLSEVNHRLQELTTNQRQLY